MENTTQFTEQSAVEICAPHLPPFVVLEAALHGCIFGLSTLGNILVILTIARVRRMHTITNIFLSSLALSDLLLTIVCLPFTIIGKVFHCFFFGTVGCKLLQFLQPFAITVSIYTLVIISIERYFAICQPLRARAYQTRKRAFKLTLAIWTLSVIGNSPALVIAKNFRLFDGRHNCRLHFISPRMMLVYWLWMIVMLFVIPLFVMTALYACVIKELWSEMWEECACASTPLYRMMTNKIVSNGAQEALVPKKSHSVEVSKLLGHAKPKPSPTKGNATFSISSGLHAVANNVIVTAAPNEETMREELGLEPMPVETNGLRRNGGNQSNTKTRRHVIKMLLLFVLIFFLSWLPFYSFILISSLGFVDWRNEQMVFLHGVLYLIAMSSTVVNPLTFCFMNNRFRSALADLLHFRESDRIVMVGSIGPVNGGLQ